MKIKKLLAKAQEIFDSDQRERVEKKKHLKKVIKKLRSYEDKLRAQLQEETDQTSVEKLKRKISLVHAQRKKGIILMQQLSDNKKSEG